jgi:hypothetical protein
MMLFIMISYVDSDRRRQHLLKPLQRHNLPTEDMINMRIRKTINFRCILFTSFGFLDKD